MDKTEALLALSALSHGSRLDIFRLLVEIGTKGLTVGSIGKTLNIAPATLNHHLSRLKLAGLVRCDRDGQKLIHRADYDRMNDMLSYLTQNCCKGADCTTI